MNTEEPEKKNTQQTAKKAISILHEHDARFVELTKKQKTNLLVAFAMKNKVIYGKAFDVVKINDDVDLNSIESISKNLNQIVVYEIKSTGKKEVKDDFEKYFFGLTTAELLVAQNLKNNYKFAFVNINTKQVLELSLSDMFKKAKGIYPVWSIQF
jgi:hypothetical protein